MLHCQRSRRSSLVLTLVTELPSATAGGGGSLLNLLPFVGKKQMKPTELIAFHGPDCDLCDEMEPFMKKVEKELGKRILRFDVASSKNYNLLTRLDHENRCNGLPYFYNRANHRTVCGATTYDNLRKWASGDSGVKEFFSPPVSKEYEEVIVRNTGFKARLGKRLEKIKNEGMSKMM